MGVLLRLANDATVALILETTVLGSGAEENIVCCVLPFHEAFLCNVYGTHESTSAATSIRLHADAVSWPAWASHKLSWDISRVESVSALPPLCPITALHLVDYFPHQGNSPGPNFPTHTRRLGGVRKSKQLQGRGQGPFSTIRRFDAICSSVMHVTSRTLYRKPLACLVDISWQDSSASNPNTRRRSARCT